MLQIRRVVLALVALTVIVYGGLALTSGPVRTEEPGQSRLDAIITRKVLRVGTTGDYRPFSYHDAQTNTYEGIDIEMARSLGKALGVEVEFVPTTWANLLPDLLADKYDIAMGGVSVSLERQKKALFSTPYLLDGKAAVARCADQAKYQSLAEIDKPGVRAIVNPGGTNERFARANLKQANLEVYPDNKTIWQQILDGKADVMITDGSETRFWQKEHPGLCAIHPDQPFNFSEKGYMVPRDMVWKAFVDQWLRDAIESKSYQAIFSKWLG